MAGAAAGIEVASYGFGTVGAVSLAGGSFMAFSGAKDNYVKAFGPGYVYQEGAAVEKSFTGGVTGSYNPPYF